MKFLRYAVLFFSTFHNAKAQQAALEKIQSQGAAVSVLVVDLNSGKNVFEFNSQKRLTPASITKILTAATALEKFGPSYSFVSKFYTNGEITNGVVKGDLIFVGDGDPGLTNEKIWFLCSDIARRGISRVTGSLILNTSKFSDISVDANRRAGSVTSSHAYDSALSAAALNYSVLAAVVSADSKGKTKAALEPYPMEGFNIVNGVTVGGGTSLSASRTSSGDNVRINVTGVVKSKSFPARVYRSAGDADRYSGNVLRSFLQNNGVKIEGKIVANKNPVSTKWIPLSEIEGFPLDWQLQGLMKVSNNFIADMLVLNLGTSVTSPGSLEKGNKELFTYLKESYKSNFNQDKLVIESGSGLTPENKFSALDIVNVLTRVYQSPQIFPAMLNALPIPGVEGTLKRRFKNKDGKIVQQIMRAKTGTLTQPNTVVSLAGYLRPKAERWLAFAVILNGTSKAGFGVDLFRNTIDETLFEILEAESEN